jgi:molybdate transport system substrate-binding protein
MLQNAHVTIPADKITRGEDVKATLAAVTTGDADAAIVYTTDALSAGTSVATVAIPDAQNVIASYPIGVIAKSGNKATAQAFAAYVTSPAGEATLKSFGFLPPT